MRFDANGFALAVFAYLSGSILYGVIVARRRGVDLRKVGSGNLGATNVGRALGPGVGRWVLVLDALKGFVPTLAARLALGDGPWTSIAGFMAVLGHCCPVFFRFRGGKGAATAFGVTLAVWPVSACLAITVFALLRRATGRASIGTLAGVFVALILLPVEGGALPGVVLDVLAAPRSVEPYLMSCAVALLVIARHRENLRRLWAGTEHRID